MLTKHIEGGKHQWSNYRSERRLNKMAVRRGDDLPIQEGMKCKRRISWYNYEHSSYATVDRWLRSWVGQPWNRVHSELVYRVGFGSERYLNAIRNINAQWDFWIDDNDCLQFTERPRINYKPPKTEVLAIGKRRFWFDKKLRFWFELIMDKWVEPVYIKVCLYRNNGGKDIYSKYQISGSRDVFIHKLTKNRSYPLYYSPVTGNWGTVFNRGAERKFQYGDSELYCKAIKQCNKKDLKLIKKELSNADER